MVGRLIYWYKLILIVFLSFTCQGQESIESVFPLKWKSKIGVTTYRTNILFHNSSIYIGSNGTDRNIKNDDLDGVYEIDAQSGKIIRRFTSQLLGDNDVNGVAISNNRLYFGGDDRHFYCFDLKTGEELWKRNVGFEIESCPVLVDMNNDKKRDVIFNSENSGVTVLDGITGELIWFNDEIVNHSGNMTPAVWDLNRDGTPDIVTAGRGEPNSDAIGLGKMVHYGDYHFAIDGKSGKIMWVQESGAGIHASPCIAVYKDKIRIAGYDAYGELTYMDEEGKQIFGATFGYNGFSSPILVEGNIMVLCNSPHLITLDVSPKYILNNEEKGFTYISKEAPYKSLDLKNKLSATPIIADIIGNKEQEILIPNEHGILVIADMSAQELYRLKIPSGAEASCFVQDIDNDGKNELLIADLNGYLYCYETNSKGAATWGAYRSNKYNTGVIDHR